MAHVKRREPSELKNEHCSSSFSALFFDSTVPCNLSLRRLFCERTKAFPTSRLPTVLNPERL